VAPTRKSANGHQQQDYEKNGDHDRFFPSVGCRAIAETGFFPTQPLKRGLRFEDIGASV
jgi:hypothetical protein